MADPVRPFELAVLRPLQVLLLGVALVSLIRAEWLWLGGAVLALLYLGVVGSKLHPLQSARDLAEGPLESPRAKAEAAVLPDTMKFLLVGHACTRVGILVGVAAGASLLTFAHWRWYAASIAGAIVMTLAGGTLKAIFAPVLPPR